MEKDLEKDVAEISNELSNHSRLELQDVELNNETQESTPSHIAHEAAAQGDDLGPMAAIKAYPMAIFWAVAVAMCVVMEGYDCILIGNFYSYPTFAKKYGTYYPEVGNYQLTAAWQAGLGNASGVGAFFGVLLKYVPHRVLLGALFTLSALVFITFFAPNIVVLTIGELLCGLPWGVFATMAPAYSTEVLPMSLRVYLTSYTNMCFIIGQLIAAGVLDGLVSRTDDWSYRIPFALQWMWPAFLIPILIFVPESPWHLVRKGRLEEAEHSLKLLVRKSSGIDTKITLANIVQTNKTEEELSAGTSYLDCFKGVERRRTEIACATFAGQVLAGSPFAYNSTYFQQQIGIETSTTYKLNTGTTGIALLGMLVAWFFLMPYIGRRRIYLFGMFVMSMILMNIGSLSTEKSTDETVTEGIAMTQAVSTMIWTFVFQLSVGQLGWAIPSEIGSTRLRQKTICLARNAYYICLVIANVLEPYFMNPTEWNLKGYTGFVWGTTAMLMFVWAYYRLPETKGRSFEDLDLMFAEKVPARKFKEYKVRGLEDGGLEDSDSAEKVSVSPV